MHIAPAPDVELFAGAGGFAEGLAALGIHDVTGIELDPIACATARAAGHDRIQADVTALNPAEYTGARRFLGAPPCPGFSASGAHKGLDDTARVHDLIDQFARGETAPIGGWADHRSHLVAEPVRWIRILRPETVCLEQVPAVLPFWQHTAQVLTGWGYSAWTGIIDARNFGAPQRRKRAILIASHVVPVAGPAPTHAEVPAGGLLPWVPMAAAIGWGMTAKPSPTVTGGGAYTGGAEPFGNAARKGMLRERDAGRWIERGIDSVRPTPAETAALQTFRRGYPWQGGSNAQHLQIGNTIPVRLAAHVIAAALGLAYRPDVVAGQVFPLTREEPVVLKPAA